MKHSTRLYVIAMIMAVIQFYDTQGLAFGIWALLSLVFARLCEGAEALEAQEQSRHKD
jgi:hypothetical protein